MRYNGFGVATSDFAVAAPRIAEAADGLDAALAGTLGRLDEHRFWQNDYEFECEYLRAWRSAADLAGQCAQALREIAERLVGASSAYAAAEDGAVATVRAAGRPGALG